MRETTDANGSSSASRLWNRNFQLLWQGQFVSQLGSQAFALAMTYWLMESTGSAKLMRFVMMASMLPGVIFGPIGGTFADRHSRKSIIVASDLVRGIAVLFVASILFIEPDATGAIIVSLFAVSLLNGLAGAAFNPAISAAIPDLVPRDRIAAANSLNQFSMQIAILLGQAAGGVLYRALGAPLLFVIDGVSYLISALSESFIHLPDGPEVAGGRSVRSTLAAYRDDTIGGLRYMLGNSGMCALLMIAASINFLAMPVILLLPFFVSGQLAEGPAWYGFLLASMGAGSLAGYAILSVAKLAPAGRCATVVVSMLSVGAAFALLGATRSPLLSVLLFLLTGICTAFINVISMSLFQIVAPPEMRGRVMSMVYVASGVAAPLGMAIGGVLGDLTNKDIPAIYLGCGLSIVFIGVIAALQRPIRDFLAHEPD